MVSESEYTHECMEYILYLGCADINMPVLYLDVWFHGHSHKRSQPLYSDSIFLSPRHSLCLHIYTISYFGMDCCHTLKWREQKKWDRGIEDKVCVCVCAEGGGVEM